MRRGPLTLADVCGSVDALRVTCPKCDRFSQAHVERLIYEFGPRETVTSWTARITADCPRRCRHSVADPCAARLVDLPTTTWTEAGTGLLAPANADK